MARATRLDSYRAANNLLCMALDGEICLCHHPPGYSSETGKIHNCIEGPFLMQRFYSPFEVTDILFVLLEKKTLNIKLSADYSLNFYSTTPSKATL
jgi:hypothetical protein